MLINIAIGRIVWSEEDQQFVGLCAEFPLLSWLASSKESALEGICKLVSKKLAQPHPSDEPSPEPLSLQSDRGKFVAEAPTEEFHKLILKAAEGRAILNEMISQKLSQ